MPKRKNLLTILAVAVLLVLMFLGTIVDFAVNYQWFSSLGYLNTFLLELVTKLKIVVPTFILLSVLLIMYFKELFRKYIKIAQVGVEKKEQKDMNKILLLISVGLGFLLANIIADEMWFKSLLILNKKTFSLMDPIFMRDISFYIFSVPFLESLVGICITITILIAVATLMFYVIMMKKHPPSEGTVYYLNDFRGPVNIMSLFKREAFKNAVKRIAVLGSIFFALLGLSFLIKSFDLLYSDRGVAFGASYTDVNITLKGYIAVSIVSFISAVLFFIGMMRDKKRLIVAGPIMILVIGILMTASGTFVQQFIVEPDEISKEKEFLEYNIMYTQQAYNLDKVQIKEFPVEQNLTAEDLENNEETVSNIRINDERPLLQTYNQLQGLRLYYEFNNVALDRYKIDGKYTQVFVSPRELNVDSINESAQTWINRHLKYTHGYGVVVSPVNAVTSNGQPKFLMKNIPPITDTDLKITRPEIYFGLKTNDYIIVNAGESEFDYPSGSDNKETRYEGTDGISLEGINRLLYTIKQSSSKIFLSNNVTDDSKIMFNRNIMKRIKKIAPFLIYDSKPYMIINQDDGKLYWVVDAYTASDNYPYSQSYPFKGYNINYLRNSVKVVIDAYNGTTDFYVYDDEDPIIATYASIYDDLFKPRSEMPSGIESHVKYPQNLFELQANVYKKYHVENPMVFYNGEDHWDIANEKYMEAVQEIQSNYVMFKLPEEEKEEFALILPYTPKEKHNMTSLLVARNDKENYGKLYMYRFSKDKTIDGPMLIENRIDQNSDISPQFTLWGQEGSAVLRGNIIVVPIENSLIYVEPIYMQADNEDSLPEMKRVIVAYKDQIVMEENLELALDKIFKYKKARPITDPEDPGRTDEEIEQSTEDIYELFNQINSLLESSKMSLEELEEAVEKLNQELNR